MSFAVDVPRPRTITARERQILVLVSRGLSAKSVARAIDIAPRTVERHIDNLRIKMGARNRCHMITRAWASGHLSAEAVRG